MLVGSVKTFTVGVGDTAFVGTGVYVGFTTIGVGVIGTGEGVKVGITTTGVGVGTGFSVGVTFTSIGVGLGVGV